MSLFYQAFPNSDAVRHELSWTHYRLLLRAKDHQARVRYMAKAATQHGGSLSLTVSKMGILRNKGHQL